MLVNWEEKREKHEMDIKKRGKRDTEGSYDPLPVRVPPMGGFNK